MMKVDGKRDGGEEGERRQLVDDNTKGTMIQMTGKGIFKFKKGRFLFPLPSSEIDQGGEAADVTPALIPFPTQQVHGDTPGKMWEEAMGGENGKQGDLESPLGGLNWRVLKIKIKS